MKRSLSIAISILLSVLVLSACGQSTQEQWQEQYDLGIRYLSEGNYEEAIIAFTAAIEIDPNRAEAYVGRGDAYINTATTNETFSIALLDYKKAIELDDSLIEVYLAIAQIYSKLGQNDIAVDILKQGYIATSASAINDKISIFEQKHLFTDNMMSKEELCIGDTPFWTMSIFEACNYYVNEVPLPELSFTETPQRVDDGYIYNVFTEAPSGWGGQLAIETVRMQQDITSEGLDSVVYSFKHNYWQNNDEYWCSVPLYIRNLCAQMPFEEFLKDIGISDTGLLELPSNNCYIHLDCSNDGDWTCSWGNALESTSNEVGVTIRWHTEEDDIFVSASFGFIEDQLSNIRLSYS